jgi:hypothetical protein
MELHIDTMHQLFSTWDYAVMATLVAFAVIVLGWQVIRGTFARS